MGNNKRMNTILNKSYITLIICLLCQYAQGQSKRPNLIVMVADDLGYADVGYHGLRKDIYTPNIDELAKQSVVFSEGYVTAPVCGPSRAGLLTGCYQQRFGFKDNPGPYRPSPEITPGISSDFPTLATSLNEVGYKTIAIGKWHLGGQEDEKFIPTNKGFDHFYGFLGGASSYYSEDNASQAFLSDNQPIPMPNRYLTDLFGEKAVEFIEKQSDSKPFFMYWAPNAVHSPLEAPKEVLAKYAHIKDEMRRKLVAMHHVMDKNIGNIVEALEKKGLLENTMIVFISDNGGIPNNNASINLPLNGEKGTLYEGGIRVPYFMYYPKKLPKAKTYNKMVSSLDIHPTLLALAGVKPSEKLDGVDLMPYLTEKNRDNPHKNLYWKNANKWGVRDLEWKLFYDKKAKRQKLYHIAKDPYEKEDVYKKYPQQVKRLTKMYQKWDSQNATFSWGWNPSAVGKYKIDLQFTFEELVSERFTSNDFRSVEVVHNTEKQDINKSEKVLSLAFDKPSQSMIAKAKHTPMLSKGVKYAHIKVLSKQPFQMKLKMKVSDNEFFTVESTRPYAGKGQWQDMLFDIRALKGKWKGIALELTGLSGKGEVLVDDIWWNNNAKEITKLNLQKVERLQIFPSIKDSDSKVLTWQEIPNISSYVVRYQGKVISRTNKNYILISKEFQLAELSVTTDRKI